MFDRSCQNSINFIGSYQPWSAWSGWTECAGGRCGNSGLKNRTRRRKFFSRKIWNETTGEYLMQTQKDEKACTTRDCPGINSLCKNQNFALQTNSWMNYDIGKFYLCFNKNIYLSTLSYI